MKKQQLLISALLTMTLLGCNSEEDSSKTAEADKSENTQAVSSSKTIAKINGVAIPESRLNIYSNGQPVTDENRGKMLENMITSELIASHAKQQNYHLREEVQQEIIVTEQSVLGRAFTQDFLANNIIDQSLIEAEYQKILDENADKIEYKTSHILVDNEALAKDLLKQITKDATKFADLAKEHSTDPGSSVTGGDLGWLTTERLVPQFAAAMEKLKAGDLSAEPVKTDYGWHVIRVDGTRTVQPSELNEQLRVQIEQNLQAKQFIDLIDELTQKATIEIIDATN